MGWLAAANAPQAGSRPIGARCSGGNTDEPMRDRTEEPDA